MNKPCALAPVALFAFNRPETTAQVFEVIRQVKPERLLLVADGPRPDRLGEAERCAAVRLILARVDWKCDVLSHFSDLNLGCRKRISSGLDWVFSKVAEAIILEDDCVPHPTFFRFCTELLERYRDDERVMHIGGANFQFGRLPLADSYYFSRYSHVWGWASWRRAWQYYDVTLRAWSEPHRRADYLAGFETPGEREFWRRTWEAVSRGQIDTWDYQWAFACLVRSALAIVPAANLVTNIGFGFEATHTRRTSRVANLPVREMEFPLRHPAQVARNVHADDHTRQLFFTGAGLFARLKRWVRRRG